MPDSDAPSDPDALTVKLRFWSALGVAFKRVLLENRWIVPFALVLGLIAAGMASAAEAKRGLEPDWQHQVMRVVVLLLPGLAILLLRLRGWPQILVTALICVPSALVWYWQDAAMIPVNQYGQVAVPQAYEVKRYLVMAGLLSPILALALYHRGTILDRYLLREFLWPFGFCLVAFFSIWLIFDLNDNLSDFRKHRPSWGEILNFYGVQIPHIFTKIAAAAVLIATVYALSRLSRTNEFIAMLGSGRSFGRTLLPLFLAGGYISFLYLVFNYEAAPEGEGLKETLLDQFGEGKTATATKHLYVNATGDRAWYIGEIPHNVSEPLRFVDVQEQDADQRRVRSIQAAEATWDSETAQWSFRRAWVTRFPADGSPAKARYAERHHESAWAETPWQVVSQRVDSDFLGVPRLLSHLETSARDGLPTPKDHLTNLYHRWAAPWSCLAILFVAAPLGIAFSRRGILGGVASAIFLFGAILFLTELSLALGKGGHLAPMLAAWLCNLVFLVLGGLFLYLRARNRRFRLPRLRAIRV